ncbi:MmyB family transcriptional regulator [Conyzicola nivalis]|uniref:MmyB family transcriptional regulator n=1 Tax=Conyzicola nivalis TaxID=1477021 RepID=UPI001E4EE017
MDGESAAYLRKLAQGGAEGREPFADSFAVDASVQALLAQWAHTPAFVINRTQDVLVSNALASALGPGYMEPGANLVFQIFSSEARANAADWEQTANKAVAALRMHADLNDPRLQEIVGALSTSDPDFPRIWARHDTASLTSGVSRHHIEPIGWVDFNWQNFAIPGSTHILVTYWADPGSPAETAVAYLAARTLQARALTAGGASGASAGSRPESMPTAEAVPTTPRRPAPTA